MANNDDNAGLSVSRYDAERRLQFAEKQLDRLRASRMKSRGQVTRTWLDAREHVGFALKRVSDFTLSGIALLLLLPVFTLIAIAIKLTDGGPVLFWQARVGRRGQIFHFPKFRSMVVDAEKRKDDLLKQNQHGEAGITFKMKRDPRVTPVGAFLRRFSLDELPQLWCVFLGHMALVGPRPAVPRETALYKSADRRRLEATPGLTCIWQVSGRSEIPFVEQVEMDWNYIHQQSLLHDIWLILKTIPAVIRGRGAY